MLKLNKLFFAGLVLATSILFSIASQGNAHAAGEIFQYTDVKNTAISAKGGIFDQYKALKKTHTFIDGAGTNGEKIYRSHPTNTISNYPGECITSIYVTSSGKTSIKLLECNNADKQSEIEKALSKQVSITVNKSSEQLRNEELARDRIAYTNALRASPEALNAFCADMPDRSECSNDIGARFQQCFNGHVNDNNFTFPNYNIDTLSSCLAGNDNAKKNIYRAALSSVDENVQEDNTTIPEQTDDTTVTPIADSATSCAVEGVGWIVCPVMNFLSGIVDAAYDFVSSLLAVQPLVVTGGDTGIYNAWVVMRNIANVAFVIAFIIIIFSQITSLGVSNYGVKKMLPRLVVAAILVNLSFWICALAVDASNVAGSSIRGLFDIVNGNIANNGGNTLPGTTTGVGFEAMTLVVLAGATGVALYIGLSALIPAVIAAFLAILTVFIVLTLRQALIVLLIVIAPLAFVAYILPNTNDLFTKWRKLLTTLLLMYPIIAALFGASALASSIVMLGATGDYKIAIQIMGALIAIIPLALTPIVMKTAGGVLNRFGGIVNNVEKGPFDRMRKGAANYRNNQEGKRRIRALTGGGRTVFGAGRYRRETRKNAITKGIEGEASRAQAAFVSTQAQDVDAFRNQLAGGSRLRASGEQANTNALANAINIEAKLEADQVNAAKAVIENANLSGAERQTLATTGIVTRDGKTYGTKIMQKAAIQEQMRTGSMEQIHKIIEQSGSNLSDFKISIAQGVAANGVASKNPALGGATIDKISQGDIKNSADLDKVIVKTVQEGKFTAESVAGMHDYARQRTIDAVENSADLTAKTEAKSRLKVAAETIVKNEELRGKISGNAAATVQIDHMRNNF